MNPNHPGWQRLLDAVNNPDAMWDEDAHQAHQAELIERAHVEQWDREMES